MLRSSLHFRSLSKPSLVLFSLFIAAGLSFGCDDDPVTPADTHDQSETELPNPDQDQLDPDTEQDTLPDEEIDELDEVQEIDELDEIDEPDEIDELDELDGDDEVIVPPENVIENWDFELWQDELPIFWFGPESSIESGAIFQVSQNVYSGEHACGLVNGNNGHVRFATAMMSLPAGRYDCTFEARGTGEVRAGAYIDGDYRYGGYTTLSDSDWQTISFDYNLAVDAVENNAFLFSVRNTSGEHVIVDHVVCARRPAPCDAVSCDDWERCNPSTVECEPLSGRCTDGADCLDWE
ncbi:MAG: hypothetical protein RBU37_14400, partial [Myxococcota bacterium]|nr:hypothetical protein [Myxococcota bacterium]